MTAKKKGPIMLSSLDPWQGLKKALELGRSDVLDCVRESNLKGRGGAGFPTGVKWNLAAGAQSEKKFIVCNADEGEPGTFKDRVVLNEYTEFMFEGMVIGAFAIGAQKGFLYLRGEYRGFLPHLENVLEKMRKDNVLGDNILAKKGFNFDIEIRLGQGAYVCGEETALIESLEGSRGEARNRPPFPVNTGFEGAPTVVNNVETFLAIPHIIVEGPDWFRSIGTEKSSGTKLLSVSGDCKKPGVYEVPFGTSIKKILDMVEAEDTKAVQVGGASGVCIVPKEFNRTICFEDLSTGGSIIVFNNKRNIADVIENFLSFFEEESCGQCTPCREGIPVLKEYLVKIKNKQLKQRDLEDLRSLIETTKLASKCGLGQSAGVAFESFLEKFKKEYKVLKEKEN
jgi:[NiFe] hydrogenase diaphorase moiety large subunit